MDTAFFVDGFNVYYSVRESEWRMKRPLRWLDIAALCRTITTSTLGPQYRLAAIHYFSAPPDHHKTSNPGRYARHMRFMDVLRATGIVVHEGRYQEKEKTLSVRHCEFVTKRGQTVTGMRGSSLRVRFKHWEEKETDVAIASKLIELAASGAIQAAVIISGDSDLVPAIKTAKALAPGLDLRVGFPAGRRSDEVRSILPGRHFRIRPKRYLDHQLPNPVNDGAGGQIHCPNRWKPNTP